MDIKRIQKVLSNLDKYLEEDHRAQTADDFKNSLWYHGWGVNRVKAEALLEKKGLKDGLFLVRCSSSHKEFVLSLVHDKKKITHYTIYQDTRDCYFQLRTDSKFSNKSQIHGLEEFIQNYRAKPNGLPTVLKSFVKGQLPPAQCRRVGKSTLLHQVVKAGLGSGTGKVLKKILKHPNKPDVNAKDEEGSTVLHIACRKGLDGVVKLLVENNADVSIRDKSSMSAIHVSCAFNHPSIITYLLEIAGSLPSEKCKITGMIPLHVAVAYGSSEAVKCLLSFNIPTMPKDAEGCTPWVIADGKKFEEIKSLLDSHEASPPETTRSEWFHPICDRAQATSILNKKGLRDGLFLIRLSSRLEGSFVITLSHESRVFHYEVINVGGTNVFEIDDGPFFESIERVVDYYGRYSDGLPTRLLYAISPNLVITKLDLQAICVPASTISYVSNEDLTCGEIYSDVVDLELKAKPAPAVSPKPALKHSQPPPPNPRVAQLNNTATARELSVSPAHNLSVFNESDVELSHEIGKGEFGSVMKGFLKLRNANGTFCRRPVAVKTLLEDAMSGNTDIRAQFLQEAELMCDLQHPHIVSLIGICHGPPVMIIQELVSMGSMLDYLYDYMERIDPETDLYIWAAQIANGMMYLESLGLVHRDLAARNILLANKSTAKISDFGLSRATGSDSDYYTASTGGRWPVKWYAPECVNYGTFSHQSDVWSYGITLYEMFSFGEQPYGDMTGSQVIQWLERDCRLAQPTDCPGQIYSLMLRCWSEAPSERPTFSELYDHFDTDDAYASTRQIVRNSSAM